MQAFVSKRIICSTPSASPRAPVLPCLQARQVVPPPRARGGHADPLRRAPSLSPRGAPAGPPPKVIHSHLASYEPYASDHTSDTHHVEQGHGSERGQLGGQSPLSTDQCSAASSLSSHRSAWTALATDRGRSCSSAPLTSTSNLARAARERCFRSPLRAGYSDGPCWYKSNK